MTSELNVSTTTVSIKGSSNPTSPSDAGSFVFTAECAMDAEPKPASLENSARWKPMINAPSAPPAMASLPKAPDTALAIAAGIFSQLILMMTKQPKI